MLCSTVVLCTGFTKHQSMTISVVAHKSSYVKSNIMLLQFQECLAESCADFIISCIVLHKDFNPMFLCLILNEYPLPMMLLQVDALPWMLFSVDRQRFQLGILFLLAGSKLWFSPEIDICMVLCWLTVCYDNVSPVSPLLMTLSWHCSHWS